MNAVVDAPTTNRGLKSRFCYERPWEFEDLSDADLAEVFRRKCAREGVAYSPPVRDRFVQGLSNRSVSC